MVEGMFSDRSDRENVLCILKGKGEGIYMGELNGKVNIIFLVMAYRRDSGHDGNHWKIKCLF